MVQGRRQRSHGGTAAVPRPAGRHGGAAAAGWFGPPAVARGPKRMPEGRQDMSALQRPQHPPLSRHRRPPARAASSPSSPTTRTCPASSWRRRSCSRSPCRLATCCLSSGGGSSVIQAVNRGGARPAWQRALHHLTRRAAAPALSLVPPLLACRPASLSRSPAQSHTPAPSHAQPHNPTRAPSRPQHALLHEPCVNPRPAACPAS